MSVLVLFRNSVICIKVSEAAGESDSDSERMKKWIKIVESKGRKECEEQKERRMRLSERGEKNLEINSRIAQVILARVKVRTSAFSFHSSVAYLAQQLL